MQTAAHTDAMAPMAMTRARSASRAFGLVANRSWSTRPCFVVPTINHKHERPRRPTVIPT